MGANDAESVEYALLMHQNVKTNFINGFHELNGLTRQNYPLTLPQEQQQLKVV